MGCLPTVIIDFTDATSVTLVFEKAPFYTIQDLTPVGSHRLDAS
jgi:hypothetical protein